MTVSQVPSDPHLILARVAAPTNQFAAFDIRSSQKAVIQFGYDLARVSRRSLLLPLPRAAQRRAPADPVYPSPPAAHTSSTGALSPTTMGRYYRGDHCDRVYAFPDYENGVKCVPLALSLNPLSAVRLVADVEHAHADCGTCATSARRSRTATSRSST